MEIQRIVIGIDFSDAAVAAAKWTARYFGDAELTLVHAVVLPQAPRFLLGRFPQLGSVEALACEGARARLDALAWSLAPATVRSEARVGKPVEKLTDVARAVDADLIVVGQHGERGYGHGRLGSTAEAIARSATIPVLLAANLRDVRPRRLLAALDDDATAPGVLRWAHALAERFNARVTALHVIPNAALSHVLSTRSVATGQTEFTEDDIRREFHEDAERWLSRLIEEGVDPTRVTSEVAFGDAATEIVAAAGRLTSELIVLGSRRPVIQASILGTIIRAVIRGADAPVLMVPETAE